MALLLDTQIIIWLEEDPTKIPDLIKTLITQELKVYFSKVSVWEMAIKLKTKKLSLMLPLETFIDNFQRDYDFFLLDISLNHVYHTQHLPYHHRDPFDRLLIAQSLVDNIQIISSDSIFDKYDVKRLW